jgi:hypothetical protein
MRDGGRKGQTGKTGKELKECMEKIVLFNPILIEMNEDDVYPGLEQRR